MGKERFFFSLLFALALQFLINTNINASTVVYTDRYDWINGFIGNDYKLTNVDFENATETSPHSKNNIITSDGISIKEQPYGAGGLYITNDGSNGNVVWFFYNNAVTISLPNNVYAFGFDLGNCTTTYNSPPAVINANLSTGEVFNLINGSEKAPILSFFGFISDVPVSSFSFKPGNTLDALLDNFSYAQAQPSPVPEPTTMLLFGTGLAGLAAVGRKKRS